jgi:hypothetical protein
VEEEQKIQCVPCSSCSDIRRSAARSRQPQHQHPARSLPLPALCSAGALFLLYKLLTFPRWRDELAHAPRFAGAVAFLLGVVVLENFCTWATSASDRRKYSYVPLQDNAEIALLWLFKVMPRVRNGGAGPCPRAARWRHTACT